VFSVGEAAGSVTKASPNVAVGVGIGVTVFVAALAIKGLKVSVTIAGTVEEAVGMPPSGVGVAYCPHNEAFPPQAASKKEAAIKKLISRFTKKGSVSEDYTCIVGSDREALKVGCRTRCLLNQRAYLEI
jgi:hypothetical protein